MKANKFIYTIYSLITVFCMFFGIPLTIVNIGKENFYIYLAIAVVGIVLFIAGTIILIILEKMKKKE